MNNVVFVYRYVELFRSYMLPIDGGSAEGQRSLRFFPAKFLRGGVKQFSQVFFRLDPTPNLCAHFVAIR